MRGRGIRISGKWAALAGRTDVIAGLLALVLFLAFLAILIVSYLQSDKQGLPGRPTAPPIVLPVENTPQPLPTEPVRSRIAYLPLVWLPLPPPLAWQPIWAAGPAVDGSVALFRGRFDVGAEHTEARLSIVADTRYEVWLDGLWLGRGPARFSRARQEFDNYALGALPAGEHVLAVLVQYAPNTRRSESLQAALMAEVRAWNGAEWETIAATGTGWRAVVSPAWDAAAGPVAAYGLIGPMEVLDLRQLPSAWREPSFDDRAWVAAVPISPSPFPALSERTIPLLRDEPRAPKAAVESGLLSPGHRLIDLEPPAAAGTTVTVTVALTALMPTLLHLEAVDTSTVVLDGSEVLAWVPLREERRPDVAAAERVIGDGRHELFISVPGERNCSGGQPDSVAEGGSPARVGSCQVPGGRTLAVRLDNLRVEPGLEAAAVHDPGRRALLANPSPGGPGAPTVDILSDYAEVTIPAGETPRYVVLDLGRTVHGRLSLVADGPAGTVLDAGWDERLTAGRPLPNPGTLGCQPWSQVDSWVLDGTPRRLSTIDARSGRYVLLQVFGAGPVSLHEVRVWEEVYPVGQAGSFESSDALLDRVWQIGVDTLRVNMVDAYTDTPWRERGQWWADAMIAFDANRAAFGDLALLRRGLRQVADTIGPDGHPAPLAPNGAGMTMLDYAMYWIEGLHSYWQLSGDDGVAAELFPAAERLAGFLASYEGGSGLMNVTPGHWSQTALVDWTAVTSRRGESTALNAQYAAVLGQLAALAEALGDHDRAQAYLDRSDAVRAAINDILFVPGEGCYSASRLDGSLEPCSLHAQAWALRYGAVPDERRVATSRWLVRQIEPFLSGQGSLGVEPLGMYALLQALAETNNTRAALALIREQYGRLIDAGATTWWELYSPDQPCFRSQSHAWGSSPTWFLSAHVLGAVVSGPAMWQVAPHPGDLASAQGAVPFGAGRLEVEWQEPHCGEFELSMAAPGETSGQIVVPVLRAGAQVALDGIVIWDGGPVGLTPVVMTADGLRIGPISGGPHRVSASFECTRVFLPIARP